MNKDKAIVFIDGSNIYFAQKKMGKWLDWVKVKKYYGQKEAHKEIIKSAERYKLETSKE